MSERDSERESTYKRESERQNAHEREGTRESERERENKRACTHAPEHAIPIPGSTIVVAHAPSNKRTHKAICAPTHVESHMNTSREIKNE